MTTAEHRVTDPADGLGTVTGPPPATTVAAAVHMLRRAAACLGMQIEDLHVVSRRRTGVYRVVVTSDPHASTQLGRIPGGRSVQAARVVAIRDSLTPAEVAHRVLYALREIGAPVAGPLHPKSIAIEDCQVGFWDWLQDTCITPDSWGELTGAFHQAGNQLPPPLAAGVGVYSPGWVFGPRMRKVRELNSSPGHPLYRASALVRRLETALEPAVEQAMQAAATQGPLVLIHGDNQPGNVMAGPDGPVLNDVERIAVGPAAVDLAGLVLGTQHYGYPPSVTDTFGNGYSEGYGQDAPTIEQALPFARIRELSGVVVAMLGAGDSAEAEREMRVRVTAIDRPGEGELWTYLGHPDATHLAGQPSADPQHNCPARPTQPAPPGPAPVAQVGQVRHRADVAPRAGSESE
jgi:Phosphotransferase enzyme family